MTKYLVSAIVLAVTMASGSAAVAQEPAKPDPEEVRQRALDEALARQLAQNAAQREELVARLNDKTPLQVQVVVARYKGDTRISSMPYVLSVNAVGSTQRLLDGESSRLRMGAQVPVPVTFPRPLADADKTPTPGAPYQYREIGTNIDCRARSMGNGAFEIGISVEDTSVFSGNEVDAGVQGVGQVPVFRSFQSSHTLILRDGQSRQFTAATDRVSGEVVRIDVSLTVVK